MKNDSKPAPELDYETMALKAQENINNEIGDDFANVFKKLNRLEKLGGTMDYKVYILKILGVAEEEVQMSMLTQVLPDHAAITAARDELEKERSIVVTAVKNRKTLALAEAA